MYKNKILIVDLDNTIISLDSFKLFLVHWFLKKPKNFFFSIHKLILFFFLFKINLINRTKLKEKFLINIFMKTKKREIEKFSNNFSKTLIDKYLRKKAKKVINEKFEKKILISASPDFYVKKIGILLGFNLVFSTKVVFSKNKIFIKGKNCYGDEKLRIIKKLKLNRQKTIFFTDSASDLPLIKYCFRSFVMPKSFLDRILLRNYPKIKW
jgi:HAD superfamily phosphoserine phosphatase-like hydrolase